ncbi:DUF1471 domain-containing protein [Enterobacteriaceae bacterium 4M9]|nr:DUF1471 domain-containing protein [Enterobacteriaceae bacterium 4M9]
MKKIIVIAAAVMMMSGATFAQSISARGTTLAEAEAKIAASAAEQDAGYRIIGTQTNNRVYMIAELIREQGSDNGA